MGFNESDSDTRRLLFDITRLITFATSIKQMKNFKETDSIAYIDMGRGKYKAYAPLSSEWDELYTDKNFDKRIGRQICDVIVKNNLENEIKIQICNQIDGQANRKNIDSQTNHKKMDVQPLKTNIKARKLVKIETLGIDLLESNKKGFEKYLKKCNELVESSKNRVITYDILEDGSYLIHIPFEREECEQWEVEYPLEVEISALPIKEDEDGFESKLRDALWDQLWTYLFDGKDEEAFDEEDEIAEKLWSMPIENAKDRYYYMDAGKADRFAMSFSAAAMIMYLRGEIDEVQQLYGDFDFAESKFAEFGIPSLFEK